MSEEKQGRNDFHSLTKNKYEEKSGISFFCLKSLTKHFLSSQAKN